MVHLDDKIEHQGPGMVKTLGTLQVSVQEASAWRDGKYCWAEGDSNPSNPEPVDCFVKVSRKRVNRQAYAGTLVPSEGGEILGFPTCGHLSHVISYIKTNHDTGQKN